MKMQDCVRASPVPLVLSPSYRVPLLLRNAHVNTLWGAFAPAVVPTYVRERIPTPDGDFLDLDWIRRGAPALLVICHGIVGDSHSHYVRSLAKRATDAGFDVLAWNCRGCSGEPNCTSRLYHSGATEDLETVLQGVQAAGRYSFTALVGFSLGANLVLKYLGEARHGARSSVAAAVAVSAPCDLEAASVKMEAPGNYLYSRHIVSHIHRKIQQKHRRYPALITTSRLRFCKTIRQCDEEYIAPLHGFESARDYYQKCSAAQYLSGITVPTLILNSRDDPFLGSSCHPVSEVRGLPGVWLELSDHGGHVSFAQLSPRFPRWHDERILRFLREEGAFCPISDTRA